jgi:DNA repair exonuclease SbcCD ATPase subunit
MKIKKVEWKNFASYGNRKQILEFPDEPSLFQVIGENGSGKSSISQVITFAFYGKVEGKKLGDIPNRINGNAWVRVEFESDGRNIAVERGLEPSLFDLYIDGMKYDQAGQRTVQEYLSDDILGIPYYVFNNTILLSINDFKSFIKMSVQDKRAIVDKIFGFHILNQMRDALKEESKKIKESMDNLSGQMISIKNSIEKSHYEMESLASEIEEKSKERLGSLNESLEAFIKLQEIHSQKITDFKKIETEFNSSNLSANQSLTEARTKMKDILRRLSLYESDKCPTCESPLDTDFHSDVKNGLEVESKKMESNLSEIESLILDLRKKEADINSTKSDLRDKGNKISAKIIEVNREIESLSHKSGRDEQLGALKRIIDNLESDSQSIQSESFKVEEKSNWIKTLDDILGEKGVKQLAIRTILPSLNSEILDLLGQMHLDYQVVFDEEFKATIYHMGIEIPVQTLSTGEMKKVDFVVLVAIMKLMKLKFSSINLLFLDELFSSVDPDGIYSILKILQKVTRELGLNIFVINHAPMPHEIFDWKLEVKKMNNFSTITIDKF